MFCSLPQLFIGNTLIHFEPVFILKGFIRGRSSGNPGGDPGGIYDDRSTTGPPAKPFPEGPSVDPTMLPWAAGHPAPSSRSPRIAARTLLFIFSEFDLKVIMFNIV